MYIAIEGKLYNFDSVKRVEVFRKEILIYYHRYSTYERDNQYSQNYDRSDFCFEIKHTLVCSDEKQAKKVYKKLCSQLIDQGDLKKRVEKLEQMVKLAYVPKDPKAPKEATLLDLSGM